MKQIGTENFQHTQQETQLQPNRKLLTIVVVVLFFLRTLDTASLMYFGYIYVKKRRLNA